jgi:hypothetical protein
VQSYLSSFYKEVVSRFSSLKVACWLLVPKFVGSHPAEFFRAKKSSAHLTSDGK